MIRNAGIPGDATKDLLERFDQALPPGTTLVMLLVGTNDLLYPPKVVPFAVFEANLNELVRRIRARRIDLAIGTFPHCVEALYFQSYGRGYQLAGTPTERLDHGCAIIRELARKEAIPLFDFAAIANRRAPDDPASFIRNPGNAATCADGLHLTCAGAEALARAAADTVRAYGLDCRETVCFGDSLTFGVGLNPVEKYPARLAAMLDENQ